MFLPFLQDNEETVFATLPFFFKDVQTPLQLIPKVIAETTLTSYFNDSGRGVGGRMLGQGRLFCKEDSFVFKTEVLFQFVTLILITKGFSFFTL